MGYFNLNGANRRRFLENSSLLLGSIVSPLLLARAATRNDNIIPKILQAGNPNSNSGNSAIDNLGINVLPNFCSHEHWGSVNSIGRAPEQNGFRCDTISGARPNRSTSIWDLILEPYLDGWIRAANYDPNALAIASGYSSHKEWWDTKPAEALENFKSSIWPFLMTGVFQCTRKGILELYGIDIGKFNLNDWNLVDFKINQNYSDNFTWYKKTMDTVHFSELIRPVHPEFYVQKESEASSRQELSFTHTILRIDPFLDFYQTICPRRDALSRIAGIEPVDAQSWREFITRIFDLAGQNHALGIKQLQAYRRSLNYEPRTDVGISFRGDLDSNGIAAFQDWVMHECCIQAHERNWVHQVHVGTNNISHSSPLPLESLAKRYPHMNTVMIHCWPFLKEAGYLAKMVQNIYIDTCWQPVLNPAFLRDALSMWLSYVPTSKIMLGHDSTHIEMAVGSSFFTRDILAEVLLMLEKTLHIPTPELHRCARDLLHNNAVRLYKIGKEFNG